MNWIDLVLLLVVILAVWTGWRKGFLIGMLDLVTWLGSVLAGLFFYPYLAAFFQKQFPSLGIWSTPLAFLAIIIVARMILGAITNLVLRETPADAHHSPTNRFLGTIPGFVNGVINATILAALVLALPISDEISSEARDSRIVNKMAYQVEWLNDKLSPIFDEAIRKSVNKLTVEPESDKSVDLKFTVTKPGTRPDLEAQMLEMVNEERRKHGLNTLSPDPELTQVARSHSRDMFGRGYFSHVSPEGKNVADRARSASVKFMAVGENLALGPTLTICHEGLMNSPGHRANILHKSFGKVGIGILDGGKYGLMITQNFRN